VPERYLVQNPRAAWRVYDDEAVIVSPDDSTLHTLNVVATRIWERADGRTPLAAIVDALCGEFDVAPEVAARDATVFIVALSERGLITVSDVPVDAA
jgi:coenzyme PQQ synthesis protein D (PqqD)